MNELFRVLLSGDIQHSTAIHYSSETANKLLQNKLTVTGLSAGSKIGAYLDSHNHDKGIQDSVANTRFW